MVGIRGAGRKVPDLRGEWFDAISDKAAREVVSRDISRLFQALPSTAREIALVAPVYDRIIADLKSSGHDVSRGVVYGGVRLLRWS